jgi:hypothetical protein
MIRRDFPERPSNGRALDNSKPIQRAPMGVNPSGREAIFRAEGRSSLSWNPFLRVGAAIPAFAGMMRFRPSVASLLK